LNGNKAAGLGEIKRFRDYPDLLDVGLASELLGISTKTVYKLIKDGHICPKKVGRAYRISKISLLNYLEIDGK